MGFDAASFNTGVQQPQQQKPQQSQGQRGPLQLTREDVYSKDYKQRQQGWRDQGYGDQDIYNAVYGVMESLPMNQGIRNLKDVAAAQVLGLPGAMTYWNSDQTNRARALYGGTPISWSSNDSTPWGGSAATPPGHFYGLEQQKADFASWNPEVQADYLRRNKLGAPSTWGGTGGRDTADPWAPVVQLHPWEGQSGQALRAAGMQPPNLGPGTNQVPQDWAAMFQRIGPLLQMIQQLFGGRF